MWGWQSAAKLPRARNEAVTVAQSGRLLPARRSGRRSECASIMPHLRFAESLSYHTDLPRATTRCGALLAYRENEEQAARAIDPGKTAREGAEFGLEFPTQADRKKPLWFQLQPVYALVDRELDEEISAGLRGEFDGQAGAHVSQRATAVGGVSLGAMLTVLSLHDALPIWGEQAGV